MKIVECAGRDGAENRALENRLFERFDGESVLYLWQNDPCVVLGKNQVPEEEVDLPLAERLGIRVLSRATGGGAVYQDGGNLNFTVITRNRPGVSPYEWALAPVLNALLPFVPELVYNGRNDLCVLGKKVSGCASRIREDKLLLHGTLLIDADLDVLDAVLTPPEEKLQRHGVASVRSRVANLTEFCPDLTVPAVKDALIRAFAESPCFSEKGAKP